LIFVNINYIAAIKGKTEEQNRELVACTFFKAREDCRRKMEIPLSLSL
jgi:hypothetical protein